MQVKSEIQFYKSKDVGEGLSFAFVEHHELIASNDIFTPSLRDFHVIFWNKKGTVRYFVDFKEHVVKPNSIVLISKDCLHYFDDFSEEVELQSIPFSPEFLYRKDNDLEHLFNFNSTCHFEGVQIVNINTESTAFLDRMSSEMKVVFTSWQGKKREEAFYHLLSLFLIKVERNQLPNSRATLNLSENDKMIQEFNILLEQNFKTESSVQFYVDCLFTTAKTLAKFVKEVYKTPTKTVIDDRRILEIKRLLIGTSLPIKEISYALGFDEPTNMNKFFKKRVELTPATFRENHN
ncbi:MAG: AraC family transcriptional activator of pobA [Crocinitomix sp.]|jgi:AraC family transcriptional activator of pobA